MRGGYPAINLLSCIVLELLNPQQCVKTQTDQTDDVSRLHRSKADKTTQVYQVSSSPWKLTDLFDVVTRLGAGLYEHDTQLLSPLFAFLDCNLSGERGELSSINNA